MRIGRRHEGGGDGARAARVVSVLEGGYSLSPWEGSGGGAGAGSKAASGGGVGGGSTRKAAAAKTAAAAAPATAAVGKSAAAAAAAAGEGGEGKRDGGLVKGVMAHVKALAGMAE
mmetsp:Transcript_26502/g.45274  ORF Transcript_26502/g.45274 Transcript_26502/m.45274 type:complete len:115 (+) Transcript_26502:929-1273(+)